MEEFLKKIKLIKNFSVGMPFDKELLVSLFKNNVDSGDNFIFSKIKERFSSSKNKYVGYVDNRGFQIRRRKKFFSNNKDSSIVNGVFRQKGDKLYMETEVKGFSLLSMSSYICIVLFCLYFVGFKLIEGNEPPFSIVLGLLIEVLLLFGIPYIIIKKRIKRIQLELHSDIYNWIMG